jgi:hypothetical protein
LDFIKNSDRSKLSLNLHSFISGVTLSNVLAIIKKMEKQKNDSVGQSTNRDTAIMIKRSADLANVDIPLEDLLQNFPLFSRRIHITRFLAHYEIFKLISHLPGSIIELGVYKGSSLLSFANFLEIFNTGDRSRKVYGFDTFEGLSDFSSKDGSLNEMHSKVTGGWKTGDFKETLINFINNWHEESFVPQSPRIQLVEGDIKFTAKNFIEENPGIRISLLHFDCDLYEPTMEGLKYFYDKMVPGGIILFDEYGITAWAGESAAVDEFFGKKIEIRKFSWSSLPGGYIIV